MQQPHKTLGLFHGLRAAAARCSGRNARTATSDDSFAWEQYWYQCAVCPCGCESRSVGSARAVAQLHSIFCHTRTAPHRPSQTASANWRPGAPCNLRPRQVEHRKQGNKRNILFSSLKDKLTHGPKQAYNGLPRYVGAVWFGESSSIHSFAMLQFLITFLSKRNMRLTKNYRQSLQPHGLVKKITALQGGQMVITVTNRLVQQAKVPNTGMRLELSRPSGLCLR